MLQVFERLKGCQELHALRDITGQLQRNCAAMRATLEQHVRAEEQELWPLFAEHFSTAEQEEIVGRIIGRTGAEALQAMLPWVAGVLLSCVPLHPEHAQVQPWSRAEEQELLPLFAEHFSTAEQEEIVGRIIGRTGAEALQAMLPWVAGVPCVTHMI